MKTQVFNQRNKLVEGWYWLMKSNHLKKGKAKAASLSGHDLVVYRTASGRVVVLDACCPHMGAHLSLGKVHGDCVRCYFHNWAFDSDGSCADVPTMEEPPKGLRVRAWAARDKHGLVWIWTGTEVPSHDVPEPHQLKGVDFVSALGRRSKIQCHPHVVMINAIDENHFQTVHGIPGHLMKLDARTECKHNIRFVNTAPPPGETTLQRWIARFYAGSIRYKISYWYGSNGLVHMGPNFLQMHFMFALRPTAEGGTEGQIIVFTPRRKGPFGWMRSQYILFFTRIVGRYFSSGDTRIYRTIRFNYKTPVSADRSVLTFINHLEKQEYVDWSQRLQEPAGEGEHS